MTISAQTPRLSYSGNGVTTAFTTPAFLSNSDLVVVKVSSAGVATTQTITTHYTLTGSGGPTGGTCTMVTAPATGETLIIYVDPPLTQALDLVENDPLPVDEVETAFDKLTLIAQRRDNLAERSLRLADSVITGFDCELAVESTDAGKSLRVNTDGDGFEFFTGDENTGAYTASGTGAVERTVTAKLGETVSVKDFGAAGDGTTDDRAAFQLALNSGAATVLVPDGTYKVSDYLLVPAGVTLRGQSRGAILRASQNVTLYGAWGSNHQYQLVLLNGNGACVENLTINGNTYRAGGVAAQTTDRNRIEDCYIYNTTGATQGVLVTSTTNTHVRGNYVKWITASSGMQLWQVERCVVSDNIVRVVSAGGIFFTDCGYVTCNNNVVSDCGDVGIDVEGGINNTVAGNTVSACVNGELAYFTNGTGSGRVPFNVNFVGNTVYRKTTYLDGAAETPTATATDGGGIFVSSIYTGQRQVVFDSNTVYADSRYALFTNDLGATNCGITIKDNTLASTAELFRIQRAYNICVTGNVFRGLSGSEAKSNEFKNCSESEFSYNTFTYESAKTTNAALHYYTDAAIANPGPMIIGNKFYNCNSRAFKHEPFTSGVQAIVSGNLFTLGRGDGVGYQSNGGVESTAAGYPLYRGQKLYLQAAAALDLSAVTALQSGNDLVTGKLMVIGGGVPGASYEFVYSGVSATLSSRDGSGAGTGIPTSATRYATFSGSTITVTAPATALGNIEADVVTWL